ncbi:MAG: tetratricopeptide repeat protein [Verrucomicrobiota bacterium]
MGQRSTRPRILLSGVKRELASALQHAKLELQDLGADVIETLDFPEGVSVEGVLEDFQPKIASADLFLQLVGFSQGDSPSESPSDCPSTVEALYHSARQLDRPTLSLLCAPTFPFDSPPEAQAATQESSPSPPSSLLRERLPKADPDSPEIASFDELTLALKKATSSLHFPRAARVRRFRVRLFLASLLGFVALGGIAFGLLDPLQEGNTFLKKRKPPAPTKQPLQPSAVRSQLAHDLSSHQWEELSHEPSLRSQQVANRHGLRLLQEWLRHPARQAPLELLAGLPNPWENPAPIELAPLSWKVAKSEAMAGRGEWQAAIDYLQGVVRQHPAHPEPRLPLGLLLWHTGDLAQAETQLQTAAELAEPGHFAKLALVRLQLSRGRFPDATSHARSLLARKGLPQKTQFRAHLLLAQAARYQGQMEALAESLRSALEAAAGLPDSPLLAELHSLAALLPSEIDPSEEPEKHLRLALQRASPLGSWREDEALRQLARFLLQAERRAEAILLLERLATSVETLFGSNHPQLATELNLLGVALKREGRFKEAEQIYQRALQIDESRLPENDPRIARDLNNLAALYEVQERYGEAATLSKRHLLILMRRSLQENKRHPLLDVAQQHYAALLENLGHGPLYIQTSFAELEKEVAPPIAPTEPPQDEE